jgi:hypothetical protein
MLVVNLQLQKNISMLSAEQYLLGMITVTWVPVSVKLLMLFPVP